MAKTTNKEQTTRGKAWAALSIIAIALISIALVSLISFSKTQQKLAEVTQQYQPKMLIAMELTTHFYHSLSVLGNYMIEQDEYNIKLYQSKVYDIDAALDKLIQLTEKNSELEGTAQLATIRSYVDRIKDYNKQMLKLAVDVNSNMPAVGIAANQLEPLSIEMNQVVNDLLLDADQQNQSDLIPLIDNLLYNWAMVISQVRSYLAFRNSSSLADIKVYLEGVDQSVDVLERRLRNTHADQADLLAEFTGGLVQYRAVLAKVIDIHSSREWRADSTLMRNEITPALRELTTELEQLVDRQKARIDASNQDLAKQINTAEKTIHISIQIALLISVVVIFLTLRTKGLITEIKFHQEHKKQFQHKANHDELTQLPNRAHFYERFQQLVDHQDLKQTFSVLFIDLDGFKAVNDDVGHAAGDFVLKETASRLRASVRSSDMVARLGGDEFVVLLEEIHSRAIAEAVAEKICQALREVFVFQGQRLQIGCSIGVVCQDAGAPVKSASDGHSLANLIIRQADEAMYQAKRDGKNRYCVYANP